MSTPVIAPVVSGVNELLTGTSNHKAAESSGQVETTKPYDTVPKAAVLKPEKFTLKVPQQEVDHFYQLLKLSPLAPKTYENTRTDTNLFGVSHEWMSNAKKHWESAYYW